MDKASAAFEPAAPMHVYRIHDRRFDALSGEGAALRSGRWNPHHPDYRAVRVDEVVPLTWDTRLF